MPKFRVSFKQGYLPSGHANMDARTVENDCIESEMQRQARLHASKGIKPDTWKPLLYPKGYSIKGIFDFNGGKVITDN